MCVLDLPVAFAPLQAYILIKDQYTKMPRHDQLGDVRTLAQETGLAARESFAFFAQRVLGLRMTDRRCEELQEWLLAGGAREPRNTAELRPLELWKDLRDGKVAESLPALARFLLAGCAA